MANTTRYRVARFYDRGLRGERESCVEIDRHEEFESMRAASRYATYLDHTDHGKCMFGWFVILSCDGGQTWI